ncbi:MAG: 4-hydroxybenzoate octaprenyltransferase [Gammaproteobacteria bacterium]
MAAVPPSSAAPPLTRRLGHYARLARLHRPIGILLLLWPMLWALWLAAGGLPRLDVLAIFVAGTLLMRSAGCVINDYADRHFDAHVERTRERPLATGAVSAREALILFTVLVTLAAALVLLTNALTILLAVGGVALAVTYPFAKRYTHLPQVHLGAAFGWAVPMAFAAQADAVPPLAWLVFCATVLWAVIYDTEYAMVDRDDDLAIGIKSTAILFGARDRLVIGILQVVMLLNLAVIGVHAALGWPWYLGLAAAGVLFAYQQWLIRARARAGCFAAFMNNNGVGGVIFAGLAASLAG